MSPTALGSVLIVDDELPLLDALVEALSAQGYTAAGCSRAEAAVEALQTRQYDLLLTDLMMPGIDGISLLKAGMAIDPNLVGIVMTGQGTVPTAVEAMKSGAFDYILKPFRLEVILPVLARAREMRRLRLENIQLRETVAIYNLSQTIAFSLDSKVVLENTADAALQQTDADEVSIMLLTRDGNEMYVAAVRGKDREQLLGQRIAVHEGIAGWVARQSEPLILNGEVKDNRFAPFRPRAEIHSAISMPMLAAGKLVGVLNVNSLEPRRTFTPGQIKALSILTSTAAAALENEALYDALSASERRFRSWIENSSDRVTVVNLSGKILYESPSVECLLGYAQDELLGKHLIDLVHPEDQGQVLALLAENIQHPAGDASAEFRIRHGDGSWRFFEAVGRTQIDEHGEVTRLINSRDITERKQAEAAVAASESRYRTLFESNPHPMWVYDLETLQFLAVNDAAVEHYGYSQDEFLSMSIREIRPAEDMPALMANLEGTQQALHTATTWRHVKKAGERIEVEVSSHAVQWKDRPARLVLSNDITERKQAEEKLRLSDQILQRVNALVLVADCDGNMSYVSPAAKTILGYEPEELLGDKWWQVSRAEPAEAEREKAYIGRAARGEIEIPVEAYERAVQDRWGRTHWISWLDTAGPSNTLIGVGHDVTERKKAEEALREAEDKYRTLVERIPAITYIAAADESSSTLYASPQVMGILGFLPEEMTDGAGLWARQIHPDDRAHVLSALQSSRSSGNPFAAEYRMFTRDGRLVWAYDTADFVRDQEDRPLYLQGVLLDITALKQAEAAVRDSETRYRTVMERSVEAIYVYDAHTKRVVVANPAFLQLLGYSAHEVTELTLYDIVSHDRGSIDVFLDQIFSKGGISMGERVWRRKDGTTVQVEVTANKLEQSEGDLIFVVGRDITERKRAEEALREKERLLSEAQRIGQVGSWSYDIARDSLQYSDEMYRLFDVSPEKFEHNSEGFLNLIYPSDRRMVSKWMDDLRVRGQAQEIEFLIFRKNSELRYIRCRGAVEFDKTGKPARFIGTAQDVTERKLAELQIRQQIERLTALREVDQAISSSFDLNVTLDVLLSQLIAQLHVDAANVLLLDADAQILTYTAGRGFRTNALEQAPLRMTASQAIRERRAIHVQSLENKPDPRLLTPPGVSEGFVCYLGVPLVVKGKIKGLLEVFNRTPLHPYAEWLDFLNTLAGQATIAIENATLLENLEQTNRELSQAYDATIEGWSRALDLRDKETEGHTLRVTDMTLELARAFGFPEEQLVYVRWGALLHDIGKMGVPDHILLKEGELTKEEWIRMRSHPQYAYDLLKPIGFLRPALDIPYCHHEKWDGTGYPRGLKDKEIPLVARLFAVVDVWDALRSDRPYRKAWSVQQARQYICDQAGTHFDPEVVERFLKIVKE